MKNKFYLTAALLSLCTMLCAQPDMHVKSPAPNEVSVGAVRVENRGPQITVSYKVLFGINVQGCSVSLRISTDGGQTYSFTPEADHLSGDIGRISTDGDKNIVYDASADRSDIAGKPLDFKIEIRSKDVLKRETLVELNAGLAPQLSYGVTFGMVRKWGWYLKARTDFNSLSASVTCNDQGEIEDGGMVWTSGNTQKSRLVLTAGGICRVAKWLYPYAGAGYGNRTFYWEMFNGEWAKVSDASCAGLSLDAGLIFKFGKFAISAGVTNTAFKFTEAEVGIGVML